MKITDCTTQQAGECADALRELLKAAEQAERDAGKAISFDDGDDALEACEEIAFAFKTVNTDRLRDLLLACEDAERGTPAKTEVTANG